MTRRTQEIIDAIRPELQRVLPEGSQVLLFGSRARGDKDVELLVGNGRWTAAANRFVYCGMIL